MNVNTASFLDKSNKPMNKQGVERANKSSPFNPLPINKKVSSYLTGDGDCIHISKTINDPQGLWWLRYSGKTIHY